MSEPTPDLLAAAGGNRTLLREMARLCLHEDAPRLRAQLHEAARIGDCAGLESAAHALNGLVGGFSAEAARRAAAEIEAAARAGSCADMAAPIARFEQEFERLAVALRALIAEHE